jgi:hypothetical protein
MKKFELATIVTYVNSYVPKAKALYSAISAEFHEQMFLEEMCDWETGIERSKLRHFLSTCCDMLSMAYHMAIDSTLCKHLGHNIVDDGSYATPESGADNLCCTRCGQHWHHQYY